VLVTMGVAVDCRYADDDEDEGYRGAAIAKSVAQAQAASTAAKIAASRCSQPRSMQMEAGMFQLSYRLRAGVIACRVVRKVMTGLDKHFGSDASLDCAG